MIFRRIRRPFGVPYLDYVGGSMLTQYCGEYTSLTEEYLNAHSSTLESGWYTVESTFTYGTRIVCDGDVHLILCDGKTLTASNGIAVHANNSITIYAQKDGPGMGALTATSKGDIAAIGSSNYADSGVITINGGTILARSNGSNAAGIGSGSGKSCGLITLNGGDTEAGGGYYAAGIGGGSNSNGGSIVITGGTVVATGSYGRANGNGAGIGGGGGNNGTGGIVDSITITGGTVTANGNHNGAAIGSGGSNGGTPLDNSGCRINITGGTVTATTENGTAIGGGQNNIGVGNSAGIITITGGNITATLGGIGGGGTNTDGTLNLDWSDSTGASGLPRITASRYKFDTVTYADADRPFADATAPTVALTTEQIKVLAGATIKPLEVT